LSYCVNCGVKLAATEAKCPLCDTPIVNPRDPEAGKGPGAYADTVESITLQRIDRRYLGRLLVLMVMACVVILVACDLLTLSAVTWSRYAIIAGIYLVCGFGFLYSKSLYLAIAIWTAGNVLLLGAIAWLTDGMLWFYYLAAPLAIAAGLYLVFCLWSLKKKKNLLRNTGICLLICGVALIGVEVLTDLHLDNAVSLFWSIYAMLPVTALSIFLIAISFNKRLLDQIRRRVFL